MTHLAALALVAAAAAIHQRREIADAIDHAIACKFANDTGEDDD